MAEIDEIPKTYDEAVAMLARSHGQDGEPDLQIFHFHDPGREVVRLLEVSDSFQETGRVQPLPVGRSRDFPFRTAIALATRSEWEQVEAGKLLLPDGWNLAQKRQVWP